LITKSNRKDDRHDARTLARLARIDPELLGPVRHRSAKAQIHLTVIRARAELVRARVAQTGEGSRNTDRVRYEEGKMVRSELLLRWRES
jgi:hypothetical protein